MTRSGINKADSLLLLSYTKKVSDTKDMLDRQTCQRIILSHPDTSQERENTEEIHRTQDGGNKKGKIIRIAVRIDLNKKQNCEIQIRNFPQTHISYFHASLDVTAVRMISLFH